MANLGTVTRGLGPLGQTQSGLVAGALGGPAAVLGSAIVLAANALLTIRSNPTLWRFSRPDPEPLEAAAVELEPL
jgi:hypothetical protein